MPLYEFICVVCDLRFEEMKKMGEFKHPCPKCNDSCRNVPTLPNITRTGTSRETIDHFIGKNANDRWIDINTRKSAKDKIRKESGTHAVGNIVTKTEDGKINYEYKALSTERINERKSLWKEMNKVHDKANKDKKD